MGMAIPQIKFQNMSPRYTFIYNDNATYTNATEYDTGATSWNHQYNTTAIDVTGMYWLKFDVEIKLDSGGTPTGNIKVVDTDDTDTVLSVFLKTEPDWFHPTWRKKQTPGAYATREGYIRVYRLSGDQQFGVYMKTTTGDIYIKNFNIYEQLLND